MSKRLWSLILLGLLLLAGAWLFWQPGQNRATRKNAAPHAVAAAPQPSVTTVLSASTAPLVFGSRNAATNAVAKTNQFAYRLSNTPKTIGQLMNDPHAILLENAFILTGGPLNLAIPKNLKASGDPGAYIVQAGGPVNNAFRATLAAAGAQIVSYIPNNAYLVTLNAGGAAGLVGQPGVQSVLPYEPYYKVGASLLGLAAGQKNLPDNTFLTLGLFANGAAQTVDQIKQLGATVVATDQSPFGPIVRVQPPADWTALAALPGVQIVELTHRRAIANDLARVALNISTDTLATTTNYLNLYGSNVLVEVNDTGIDASHPDFTYGNTALTGGAPTIPPSGLSPNSGRVFGVSPLSLVDTNGHGTQVAGIIAGNGWESGNVLTIPQGSVTNADFRGKAPGARLYSVPALDNNGNLGISDSYLQTAPALTNALISNNSWVYTGDNTYDLAAASYDAAVRDALPLVTGSQPVLFVFAAGNDGGGNDDGSGGDADTILSPGTAKNVVTVGALEQLRTITNIVTTVTGGVTNQNPVWQTGTDSANQVAGYSGRGNVGIGSEGAFGRFKPDVVAPGSFVVSTRSAQWDQAAYYNPTNYYFEDALDQFVESLSQNNYALSLNFVPPNITLHSNVVGVDILIEPNANSPVPFPPLSIYVSSTGYPNPANPGSYDFATTSNEISIPPDGGPSYLSQLQGGNLYFSIVNTNSQRVSFDIYELLTVTNQDGDYFTVLSNLNVSIGPWYRYESGTSMATPAVSGTLALIQDYFTNTLATVPSPALLKVMLINGAVPVGNYSYNITNDVNYEGWGQPSLPDSVPLGLTNQLNAPCSTWFTDQSPTNALATGDTQTYLVTVDTNSFGQLFPLHATLAWTDPPGNPAAAIKLVNNLTLVVSNNITGEVYFGNDIAPNTTYSTPWNTNSAPNLDTINNVQNVIIPPTLGGSYSVTVIGRSVNVNAVTAQSNNVVQDYALVIACGGGEVTSAITVAAVTPVPVSNPTSDQNITFVGVNANGMSTNSGATGGVFLNQYVGANTPLLGTNTVGAVSNYTGNVVVTIGMTNQWHFYVVANTTTFSNAAFVTFLPDTLSIPRMGVFATTDANSTQPEADIDMYVSTDPSLTNLNPVVISNCVNGTQIGVSAGGAFNGASLSSGGTEFVVDTGSKAGQVYYVGIKSETAVASEYGFLPVFSQQPFSTMNNGIETVNGLLLPVPIPDGSPKHPGTAYIFALAIQPIEVQDVIVSNTIVHQRFGDLVGTLTHNGKPVVLNNHDSPLTPPEPGPYTFNYYDGPQPPQTASALNTQKTDGPGSLLGFQGLSGIGPWILTEVDDSHTQTGMVTGLTITVTPHQKLTQGINVLIPGKGYFYGYIDVPVGTTNLTIAATNVSGIVTSTGDFTGIPPDYANPGQLFEKLGEQPIPNPTVTNYDKMAILNLGFPPGNTITVGRSDVPPIEPGRYYVTLYNASPTPQEYWIIATLGIGQVAPVDFSSSGPVPLLDDAVSYAYITNYPAANATNETIASIAVGIRVDHPRISDLVFTLISPDGTRYLLMENRGGTSTNGAGATVVTTNIFSGTATGGPAGSTNYYNLNQTSGTVPITWNFYTVPDKMDVYYQGTNIFSTGLISGMGRTNVSYGPGASTQIEVVMDAPPYPNPSTLWTYTIGGVQTNFIYLDFTEDTNLTTTPIKFAPTPFAPNLASGVIWTDSFEAYPVATYPPAIFSANWTVLANSVEIVTNPPAADGVNALQLDNGAVSAILPTVAGQQYLLSYQVGSLATDGVGAVTNANWQLTSFTFIASQNNTPLVLNASGTTLSIAGAQTLIFNTNALLDAFSLTAVPGNLNYQPEQDLSPLIGTSAYGLWTLEILDDRVGATNNTVLDSWQLQFVFADTNPATAFLNPGFANCTTTPANSVTWYQVNVPLNADIATNTLFDAAVPLNLLLNTNAPDTAGAITLLSGVTNNIAILGLTNTPPLFPGGTYYLGVQNPNGAPVYACVEVDFHLLATPYAFTEPAQLVTGTSAQLNGMATPSGYASTAWFQWGTNTLYGNQTPPVPVGNGYSVVYVTNSIVNLVTNMPYHFRLVVSNALEVVYGFDQILDEAYVATWGANYDGQLNVPSNLNNVTAIAGAYDHSLDLNTNGQVVAWGDNNFGQATVPAGLSNTVAVAVAGGEYYSMALLSGGTVASWGVNILNQTNVPAGLSNVVIIAGGSFSSLALQNNGNLVVWGANFFGLTNVPASASNTVAIAGGNYHNLALKNDGTVTAWGDNSAGQTNVPPDLTNVVAIAAGSYHNLALKYDGTVVAWGYNSAGQTNVPAGLNNVVAIAAGGFHSLALKADGTVVTWGDNSAGQSSVPVGLTNVVAISAGYFHTLALTPQMLYNSTNPFVLTLVPGTPQTNSIFGNSITYYQVNVPTNADFATNTLLFTTNGTLNIWFSTNTPPVLNATNATLLGANVPSGVWVLSANIPNGLPPLVPGSTYYLGVQNPNSFTVNYGIQVDFHLAVPTNAVPPTFNFSIVYTNGGYLLTWFAPSNDVFQVQWTGSLAPASWSTFTNPPFISYNTNFPASATNAQFNFFDDGSQTGGLGLIRFYRLVLLGNTPPVLPSQTNQTVNPLNPLVVTNTAADAQSPPQTLTYTLSSTVTGTNLPVISPNGVITWTPDVSQAGSSNVFTTVVKDSGSPPLSATNSFVVFVNPVPGISSVVYSNGVYVLTWLAPTNDIFAVQVSTDLGTQVWQTIATNITYNGPLTPTNGWFSYVDYGTNVPFGPLRFYQLILTGVQPPTIPANTPPVLPLLTDVVVNPLNLLVVTNTATDTNVPAPTLTYTLTSTVTGTNVPVINPNTGVITWTPDLSQAGTSNLLTTVVTATGVPPLSATNVFAVIVNPVPGLSSVIYTNGGFLLIWFAPTNDYFQVQVSTNLSSPAAWQTFRGIVSYAGPPTPTNGMFTYFDDGTQVPFGTLRFYQLILLGVGTPPNTAPVLPGQTNLVVNPLNPLVITNTATDYDTPAQTLTYTLTSTVAGANVPVINPNSGVITWTTDVSQAGTSNLLTTVVTDNGVPPLRATNSFAVIVNPVPVIGSVIYTNGGVVLLWSAPTNDIFQVQFTDSVTPVNWQTFSNLVFYTGPVTPTNGVFSFFDNGSEYPITGPRFYRIVLVGVVLPIPPGGTINLPISVGVATNGGFMLTWTAPTNDQFNVRWTTNLVPPVSWSNFLGIVTSTNGTFNFTDTNAPLLLKFYQLILLP